MRQHSAVLALALSVTLPTSLAAQGAMRAAPSSRTTTEITLTLVDSAARAAAQPAKIRIDHGQPHLRGRALHTDSLVPYDRLWRTGANAPTTLTTDVDLVIGGATVPKGTYVLQTLPSRAGWKLLIQKPVAPPPAPQAAAAGTPPAPPAPPAYDPANDVARVDLRRTALPAPLESLSIWLIPSTQPGPARGELRLAWGTVALATDWSVK